MEITKSQQKILNAIKENNWITVTGISQKTGIAENHVRNIMKTKAFANMRKGKKLKQQVNGLRYICVYQYPHTDKSHTERALQLASMHTGIFGQLYWATELNENIERVA